MQVGRIKRKQKHFCATGKSKIKSSETKTGTDVLVMQAAIGNDNDRRSGSFFKRPILGVDSKKFGQIRDDSD